MLAYRIILFWLPLLVGTVAFLSLRRAIDKHYGTPRSVVLKERPKGATTGSARGKSHAAVAAAAMAIATTRIANFEDRIRRLRY